MHVYMHRTIVIFTQLFSIIYFYFSFVSSCCYYMSPHLKKKLVGIVHRKNKKNKSDLITNPHLYALVEHQNFYFRVVFLLISVNMGTPNTFRRVPKQLLDKED